MNSTLRRLWWLDPGWLFAAVIGSTFLAAALQGSNAYRMYGTPKFIEIKHIVFVAVLIIVFALGHALALATGRAPSATPAETDRTVRTWFWITTGLTVFGYVVWLAVGVKNGFSLATVKLMLTSKDELLADAIREEIFLHVKGVTTCTQFGVAAVPLGLWLYFRGQRKLIWPIGLLLALAIGRALMLSERLALVELALPATVVLLRCCVLGRQWAVPIRIGLRVAPVLGVIGLLLFFGGFEYFRSWRYYQKSFNSLTEFTLWRVSGYYTTAHNNGAMCLEKQKLYPVPFTTLRPIWLFPGLKDTPFGYTNLTGFDPEREYKQLLVRYATPEMNNEGGLFQPSLDFGIGGCLVFWFLCGFVTGRLYRCFLAGTLAGMLLYPIFFLAILETPRFLYLCYTRSFPGLATLVVIVWCLRTPSSRAIANPAQLLPQS